MTSMEPFDLAHQDFQLATHHFQQGDDASAEKICREIVEELPRHVGATHMLGVVCGRSGRLREAIEFLQRAAQLDPSSPDILLHLSYAQAQAGATERALAGFMRVRQINPMHIDALAMIGSLSLDLGRFSEAADALAEAADLRPRSPEVQGLKGRAMLRIGRPAEAEAPLRRSLELKPRFIESAVDLGECLVALGRFDEAEAHCRAWLGRDPRFHAVLIHCLLAQGRAEAAEEVAEQSSDSATPCADAVRLLARRDARRGERARAIERISQALPLISHDRFGMGGAMFELARLQFDAGEHGTAIETALTARRALAPEGRPAFVRGKRYLMMLDRLSAFPRDDERASWPAPDERHARVGLLVGMHGARTDMLAEALREVASLRLTDGGSTLVGLGGDVPGQPLGSEAYPRMIAQMDDAAIAQVRGTYLEQIGHADAGIAVDAHANNIEHLAALARVVPGAGAVVVVRDAADALAEAVLEAPVENASAVVLTSVQDIAAGMAGQLGALARARTLPGLRTLIVDFDALRTNPEREIKRVLAFLGAGEVDAESLRRAVERINSPRVAPLPKGASAGVSGALAAGMTLLSGADLPRADAT